MENANYLSSFIKQIVNNDIQKGIITSIDRRDLVKHLTTHCVCGRSFSEFNSDIKQKWHVKMCINRKFTEYENEILAFKQNQLLERARIDMENGKFD